MKKIIIGVSCGVIIIGIIVAFSLTGKKEVRGDQGNEVIKPARVVGEVTEVDQAQEEPKEVNLIEAKRLLKEDRLESHDPNKLRAIQKQIEEVSMSIIFSPVVDECSLVYEVQPKDVLVRIAKKHKTTVSLIKRANNLKSDMIIPGQKLKVNSCSFSVVVDKSQNILTLIQGQETIKKYIISTGANSSSPVGNFVIINKLENPTWYRTGAVIPPDSPENILGTRWMGFDLKGFGIHGTTEPDKLGTQITLGCIRMKNEEVEELYGIIPVGTEVTIID